MRFARLRLALDLVLLSARPWAVADKTFVVHASRDAGDAIHMMPMAYHYDTGHVVLTNTPPYCGPEPCPFTLINNTLSAQEGLPFPAVVDYGTDLYVDPDTGLLSAQMPAAMAAMLWSDPNEVDFFDENWQLAPPPPTMKSGVNSEGGTLSYHHNGSARQMKACLMPDSSDAYQVYVDLGKAITQNCPAFRAKTIQWYQE